MRRKNTTTEQMMDCCRSSGLLLLPELIQKVPCTKFLADHEWKVLYLKVNEKMKFVSFVFVLFFMGLISVYCDSMENGMPWLLWPIPSISLSWEYKWVSFGFNSGVWMTIAPKSPVSLIFKSGSHNYDASLLYRYFKNGNPLAEILGMGIGIKRESINVIRSDGLGISKDFAIID